MNRFVIQCTAQNDAAIDLTIVLLGCEGGS